MFLVIGTLTFTLKGQPLTLSAFDASTNDVTRLQVPIRVGETIGSTSAIGRQHKVPRTTSATRSRCDIAGQNYSRANRLSLRN
jgi:hypothetical protein